MTERADLRARIAALPSTTCAGLPDIVPLTSLEEQLAGGRRGRHDEAQR